MNPPNDASDGKAVSATAAPPNNNMSSAAGRRQMRHQLVQDHLAKITNQEETNHVQTEVSKVKREAQQKTNSFPSDTCRVQVVQARGEKTCRIVVDTPAGHSAGRIKIVMGFERIEQKPVAPKAPARAAALRPVSASLPLTTPTVRDEAPETAVEGSNRATIPRSTAKTTKPQQNIPSAANEPLQKSTTKAAPLMEANPKPSDNKVTEPQKQSKIPQKTMDSKPKAVQTQRVSIKPVPETIPPEAKTLKSTIPKQAVARKPAATYTQKVSIKPKPEPTKPAAVETGNLAAHAASQQNTSIDAKPKAPPTAKRSKVPPSYAKSKAPPSHRSKAKVPPSQRGATLTSVPASQRATAKRNNLASKDNTSLDGNSNATPLDKVESRQAKQQPPENQKKLYHGRRKYAVEDLQKMFEDKTLGNGVSIKEKKKKSKKIVKAFRV